MAICLAYTHSQMNLHMCAKFGANRSSRLTASTYFWICDPLKPPKWPLGYWWANCISPMSFPRRIRRCVPNLVPIGPAVWQLPDFWICDPLKPPGVLRGELHLAYVDSQTNPQICTKFGANRSSRLTASPKHLYWWPTTLQMPPGVLKGKLDLACVHSQMNPQTWTKVGANRTVSPDFWICDTLTPPPPRNATWGIEGDLYLAYVHSQINSQTWTKVDANRTASPDFWIFHPLKPTQVPPPCVSKANLFGVYPFPYEFAHVCQLWCQSAQPFGNFSRICATVSSACTRWLAQKHAKKQHS